MSVNNTKGNSSMPEQTIQLPQRNNGSTTNTPKGRRRTLVIGSLVGLVLIIGAAVALAVGLSQRNKKGVDNKSSGAATRSSPTPAPTPAVLTDLKTDWIDDPYEINYSNDKDFIWQPREPVFPLNCTDFPRLISSNFDQTNPNNNNGPLHQFSTMEFANRVATSADGRIVAISSPVFLQYKSSDRERNQNQLAYSLVQVFRYNTDDGNDGQSPGWTQLGTSLFPTHAGDVLALSGDGRTLVVSSGFGDFSKITTYYNRDPTENPSSQYFWDELQSLMHGDDSFGSAVAINYDGTRLALGHWTMKQVWVYQMRVGMKDSTRRNGWEPMKSTPLETGNDGHAFGFHVLLSASGNRLVASAESGRRLYTFDWSERDSQWTHSANVVSLPTNISRDAANLGVSLAAHGQHLVYGLPYLSRPVEGSDWMKETYGAFVVYKMIEGNWIQVGRTKGSMSQGFGDATAVSADGRLVAVHDMFNQTTALYAWNVTSQDYQHLSSFDTLGEDNDNGASRDIHMSEDGRTIVTNNLHSDCDQVFVYHVQ